MYQKSDTASSGNFQWLSLHKKWSFPLRIYSGNVTISAVFCLFGHIYWRNSLWRTSFFVQYFFLFWKILPKLLELHIRLKNFDWLAVLFWIGTTISFYKEASIIRGLVIPWALKIYVLFWEVTTRQNLSLSIESVVFRTHVIYHLFIIARTRLKKLYQ